MKDVYGVGFAGAITAVLLPALPFTYVCFIAMLFVAVSDYRMKKRMGIRFDFPKAVEDIILATVALYVIINFLYIIDTVIFSFKELFLANMFSGAFVFLCFMTILKNESYENKLAKELLEWVIMTVKRYVGIDLKEIFKPFKKDENRGKKDC